MDKPANLLVSPAHWQIISHILKTQLADYPVWAFGSRKPWTLDEPAGCG